MRAFLPMDEKRGGRGRATRGSDHGPKQRTKEGLGEVGTEGRSEGTEGRMARRSLPQLASHPIAPPRIPLRRMSAGQRTLGPTGWCYGGADAHGRLRHVSARPTAPLTHQQTSRTMRIHLRYQCVFNAWSGSSAGSFPLRLPLRNNQGSGQTCQRVSRIPPTMAVPTRQTTNRSTWATASRHDTLYASSALASARHWTTSPASARSTSSRVGHRHSALDDFDQDQVRTLWPLGSYAVYPGTLCASACPAPFSA